MLFLFNWKRRTPVTPETPTTTTGGNIRDYRGKIRLGQSVNYVDQKIVDRLRKNAAARKRRYVETLILTGAI